MDVSIIGAGELGGALAHALARLDTLERIRVIDETGSVAAGKALDLMQAASIDRFSTILSGGTDPLQAAGSAVIAIADRASGAEWSADEELALVGRLAHASAAVILCTRSTHRDLVDRAVRRLGLPNERILGSAPEALASAVRAMIGLETRGSPSDVALTILGAPPTRVVVPWEDVTIGGLAATKVLDEPARRRIEARLPALWPPGPYALATAAAKAIDALAGRTRRVISAFVAQRDGEADRTRTVALPVRLGPAGVTHMKLPLLSARDRIALDNAMLK
jgi:malate dehydrogenase